MQYQVTSIVELKTQINKNVYCFGAGRALDNFLTEFSSFELEKHIKAIVDNAPKMISKDINNVCIPVISLEQMLDKIDSNDCVLITTAAYEEVIEQLNTIEKLNNIKYFIYSILKIEQYDYDRLHVKTPDSLSLYEEVQIPKVIHYCWFGGKEIPAQHREWMESWRKYCPDYEIIEWHEDNYDVHKNKYIEQAYDRGCWAFVADYARIDIIYKYGGVYLDTDVELVKNIDELLKNDAFCGFESYKYVAYGLGFGAKRENAILQEIKDYYDHAMFVLEDGTLNQKTCPVIQTEIMKRHGLKGNGEFQIVGGMTVYPSIVLCGMSPYNLRMECDPVYTHAIHHRASSWIENKAERNAKLENIKKYSDWKYKELKK